MEVRDKNQNLYVLKASTIRHSDIQALPVSLYGFSNYISFSVFGDKHFGCLPYKGLNVGWEGLGR